MRRYKSKKWILVVALSILTVVGCILNIISSLIPPDKEKMENYFNQNKDDLSIIVNYLSNLNYTYITIDKSNVENGVMFTGANTHYQKIDNKTVLKSLNKLLNYERCIVIGKSDNTIFFQKWRFLEKDRGIAVSVNKEEKPSVEFLIKSESLSEIGWYYYEADYEEYRNR